VFLFWKAVAPAMLYCLRQQGTLPIFFIDDFRPAGRKLSIKGRKSTTLPKAKACPEDNRATPVKKKR
jgi:hypothetical protein